MHDTENAYALTKMKLQKGLGVIRKRKQQEGTKAIQNQKNTIIKSFSSITHGMRKMT